LDETAHSSNGRRFPKIFDRAIDTIYDSDGRCARHRMLESGPAAGVIGTRELCATIALENAIAFDHGRHDGQGGRHFSTARADRCQSWWALRDGLPIQIDDQSRRSAPVAAASRGW